MNVTTKDLKAALTALQPALKRSPYENVVQLKAGGDALTLRAGHDPLIEVRVPASDLSFDTWEAVIDAPALTPLGRATRGDLSFSLGHDKDGDPVVSVDADKTHFELSAMTKGRRAHVPLDLTPFPEPQGEAVPGFQEALARALTCSSYEHYQDQFRCVALEMKHGKLHVTGTNGFRLGTTELAYDLGGNAYLPNKTAPALKALGENVRLQIEGEYLYAWGDDISTRIFLKEVSSWVDWERIVPSWEATLCASRDHLTKALKRAALLADKTANNRIDIDMQGSHLRIVAEGAYGRSEEKVALTETPPLEFPPLAFNAAYLSDALRAQDDELVTLHAANGSTAPCVLQDGPSRMLVVPLRTQ